jgi:hypothetical protein
MQSCDNIDTKLLISGDYILDRDQYIKFIDAGNDGSVYKVLDKYTNIIYAMKVKISKRIHKSWT